MFLFRNSVRVAIVAATTLIVSAGATEQTSEDETYSRLTEPAVAAALRLSDQQKTQIAAVITQRDKELATATDETRKTIQQAAEQKLGAILNAKQTLLYRSLFSGTRLRFNFRATKWADVLDYIADEADLSLVMNEAPPGVFNYSDSKEYTPTEAVDLINGWLLTKGYTLVRRERLLMCLPLKDGLPENVLPRVKPEALETRGQFEIVRVLIPLEGRPLDAVVKEVEAIKGTYGKVTPLTATAQIMIADTAGNIRAMLPIIKAIPVPPPKPVPPKPKPKPKPTPPPEPVIVVHPIQHANPDRVGEVLKQFVGGTILVDGPANQITIKAPPAAQETAKGIIRRLEENQGPDRKPTLKTYPSEGRDTEQLTETIALAAPEARIRVEDDGETLVAWGSPAEHDRIATVLKQLKPVERGTASQLETYSIERVSPSAALALLQELLPQARMTASDETNTLIVVGSLSDHRAVRSLIEQLGDAPEAQRTLTTYDITGVPTDSITTLVTAFAPDATVSFDAPSNRAMILGRNQEHQRIAPAIKELRTSAGTRRRELRTYGSTNLDVSSVTALLGTLTPAATVTPDTTNERLVVIASAEEHARIEGVLAQVERTPVSQRTLKPYVLAEGQDATTVTTTIAALAPDATVTEDAANRRFLIVANDKDHKVIADTLTQLKESVVEVPELRFYPVEETIQTGLTTVLSSVAPDAKITLDDTARRLSVVARSADHERIKLTLAKLLGATALDEKPEMKLYEVTPAQRRRFTELTTALTAQLPGLQVISGTNPRELTVWAKPTQQGVVSRILEQLDHKIPPDRKPSLVVYPIVHVDPAGVETVLTELFPDAEIRLDAKVGRLLVRAVPAEQKAIDAAVKQLDTETPASTNIKLMAYPIGSLTSATVVSAIEAELPGLVVIPDTAAKTIVVRGRIREHEKVAAILEALQSAGDPLKQRTIVVYPAAFGTTATATAFLRRAFPGTEGAVDPIKRRMTVWATEDTHQKIAEAIAVITKAERGATAPVAKSYPLDGVNANQLLLMLGKTVPDAQVVANTASTRLVAWATPEDQETIAAVIAGTTTDEGQEDWIAKTYVLEGVNAKQLVLMLGKSVPDAQAVANTAGTRLVTWANPDDQKTIDAIVAGATKSDGQADRIAKTYALEGVNAKQLVLMLSNTVPRAEVVANTLGTQLVAWADADDQKTIAAIVSGAATSDRKADWNARSYSLHGVDARRLVLMLNKALPEAHTVASTDGSKLVAWADPDDQKAIESIVSGATIGSSEDRDLRIFEVSSGNVDVAKDILESAFADVTFFVAESGTALLAWADDDQAAQIESMVTKFETSAAVTNKRSVQVFDVAGVGAETARTALVESFPDVTFVDSPDGRSLIAGVTTRQNTEIKAAITQMKTAVGSSPKRELASFDIQGLDADSLRETIEPLVDDDVRVTVDATGRRLFVRAFPDKLQRISQLVRGVIDSLPSRKGVTTKAYRTLIGDADEVQEAIAGLLPDAVLVTDTERKVVVATALPEEHRVIAQVVEQLVSDGGESRLTAKTYPIRSGDGKILETSLQALYRRAEARISYDPGSRTLLAVARDDQHAAIRALIEQVESAGAPEDRRTVEFYSLEGADGEAVSNVVTDLLDVVDPKASVVNDDGSRQLVVTTIAEGHAKVKDAIERLQSTAAPREFEVFQLNRLEAFSAEMAVESMFDDSLRGGRDAPVIQSDAESQQLMVRGTTKQIEDIRKLLIKMGETTLQDRGSGSGRLRVIPIHGDAAAAIRAVEKIWPKLRKNPIRVLVPGQKKLPQPAPPKTKPEPQLPDDCSAEPPMQEGTTEQAAEKPKQQTSPVVIVPGKDRITISSDDIEALNQMESLFRAVFSGGSRRPRSRRDFTVYALSNAAASTVSDLLNNIFAREDSPIASGNVVIATDPRLNALIVFAGRTDRERIEQLIEVLDSADVPETIATNRTKVLPVKYAAAETIHDVLSGIYRAQMTAGGSRQSISIPRGVPASVATVLRQINAASSSPLLSVQVEETTNSLVIMAPQNLLDDVTALATQLDQAAGRSRARGISIIELKKTNSKRVMDVLQRVLK